MNSGWVFVNRVIKSLIFFIQNGPRKSSPTSGWATRKYQYSSQGHVQNGRRATFSCPILYKKQRHYYPVHKNPATVHSVLRETNSFNTFISISILILSYHVGLQRSLPFISDFPITILLVLFQVCHRPSVRSMYHSCVVFERPRVLISIRKPSILKYKLFSLSHYSHMLDRPSN